MGLRAYARRCSASHVAVHKAIDKKIIVAGWDAVKEEIIVAEADREWGEGFMAKKGVTPMNPATEKQREIADAINSAAEKKEPTTRQEKSAVKKGERETSGDDEGSIEWEGGEIPNDIKFAEALRIERIQMARHKMMQADELEGLLVRKALVQRQLIVAGIEVRKAIERFPTTVIDKVLSAKNRTAALKVLDDAVTELLETLQERITTAIGASEEKETSTNE